VSGAMTTYLSFSTDKIVVLAKLGDSIFKNCVKLPELTEFIIFVVNEEYSRSGETDLLSGMVISRDTSILYPCILKNVRRRLGCITAPIYFTKDVLIFIEFEVAIIMALWL
jgi:hypothetical protein